MALCDGLAISSFNLDLSGIGEKPSALSLTGGIGKGTLTAGLENVPQGRRITVAASDTGTLAHALTTFSGLTGGTLAVTATLPGRATDPNNASVPDFQGTLTITNFKMVNQSFFARLFSAVSFTGVGDLLQGYLEASNVNSVTEIADLIAAQRAYEMNARVITGADEMMQATSQLR